MQERDSETKWIVRYVSPEDKTWYNTDSDSLLIALQNAIDNLE